MPIAAGKLDRRITIQARTTTRGTAGSAVVSYADEATIWAERVDLTGGKLRASAALRADASQVFRIRYRPTLTEQHRIRYNGRSYDILQIDEEGRREGMLVQARFVEGKP